MRIWMRLACGMTALLGLTASGCGDATGGVEEKVSAQPVKGKVVLPDGQPLTDGMITFVPTGEHGRQAAGKVGPDGRFTLTTNAPDDGAGEGDYQVRISTTLTKAGPRKTQVPIVPAKYDDEGTSGLTAHVNPGENTFEFKLDDKPNKVIASAKDRD